MQVWVVTHYIYSVTCTWNFFSNTNCTYSSFNAEQFSLLLKYIFYLNCFTHALLHQATCFATFMGKKMCTRTASSLNVDCMNIQAFLDAALASSSYVNSTAVLNQGTWQWKLLEVNHQCLSGYCWENELHGDVHIVALYGRCMENYLFALLSLLF